MHSNLGKELLLTSDWECEEERLTLVLAMSPANFHCQAVFQRLRDEKAVSLERLGEVEIDHDTGLELGVSGLELKHDQLLRGKLTRVPVGDEGQWRGLNEIQRLGEQGNGEDVILVEAEL